MTPNSIPTLIAAQRSFFSSGTTANLSYRKDSLKKLFEATSTYEKEILKALHEDLGRPDFESFAMEIGVIRDEITHALKHLDDWAQPTKVPTSIIHFWATSEYRKEPLGVVLNIAPWNYPFQLCLAPLVSAIAAGNCVVLKPSELAPHTSSVIHKIISASFKEEHAAVVEGGITETQLLMKQKFDHIFFTGGTAIGRLIMIEAAQQLTPVTLELGGKSPCIVDSSADIDLAARRITWGKFVNAGQTCVAPDYILIHQSKKDEFIVSMKKMIHQFYGSNPLESPDYCKIVNEKHFSRLSSLIAKTKGKIHGGRFDTNKRQIEPTLVENLDINDETMRDEIFGPILPILSYSSDSEIFSTIAQRPKPLALYLFAKNKSLEEKILSQVQFGGGCINDTLVHLGSSYLPFGGIGTSGIGAYHGIFGFDLFSHRKSILRKTTIYDLPARYAPYSKFKMALVKFLFP